MQMRTNSRNNDNPSCSIAKCQVTFDPDSLGPAQEALPPGLGLSLCLICFNTYT